MDVLKLRGVDMLALLRLLIHEHPESHPDITDGTDDDESHLPAAADALVLEILGKKRNRCRSDEGTYGSASIEYGGRECAVLLREILSGGLDSCREVAGLTEGEHGTRRYKEPYTYRSYRKSRGGTVLYSLHRLDALKAGDVACSPSAGSMKAGAGRPYSNGPEIALLRAHPVHELAGEKHAHGIDDGEDGGDCTIIVVCPVEFRSDEVLPCKGQHLAVHVVDGGRKEEQHHHPPAPVGHQFLLC